MRAGRGTLSRGRSALVLAGCQGAFFTLLLYACFDGPWWRVLAGGAVYTVGMAAVWRSTRLAGFESLSDAEQAAVISAFRRGQPVAPELAPALLAYCGTVLRASRFLWVLALLGGFFVFCVIAGTVLLLGHAAHAEIRGSIFIAEAFAIVAVMAWRRWWLPRRIREAERLARASLSAQTA